jgi:hypothetical protein
MHKVTDVALAIVAVAAIMVIVRPGSQASSVIRSIGSSFAGAISAATGSTGGQAPRRRVQARPRGRGGK